VSAPARDRWAEWLLDRRFGGEIARRDEAMEDLGRVRDRVLDAAAPLPGETLLDVGAGDGLIAFGAVDRVGPSGKVIFSDISEDLLEHSRLLAGELGVLGGCDFVRASADELEPIGDGTVDIVTTRSVLIYIERDRKRRAFGEFDRVLRPGGRLSIFEPINKFGHPAPEGWFCGYDLTAVSELVCKVLNVVSPEEENTLIDFDERDLLAWVEKAGFESIHLDYVVDLERGSWLSGSWESVLRTSGNPLAPTLGEAIEEALTPAEQAEFEAHLRPLVEADVGRARSATAYLSAKKA
jgi:arsenite methyltransferase